MEFLANIPSFVNYSGLQFRSLYLDLVQDLHRRETDQSNYRKPECDVITNCGRGTKYVILYFGLCTPFHISGRTWIVGIHRGATGNTASDHQFCHMCRWHF